MTATELLRNRRVTDVWHLVARVFLNPVAAICLAHSPWVGLGLWLVLLQQPRLAIVGAVTLGVIETVSTWWQRRPGEAGLSLAVRANGLLSALAGGWVFLPADQSPILSAALIAGTVLGGLLFTFLARDLVAKTGLPALVWPYCLIALIVFAIFPEAPARSMGFFQWPQFEVGSALDLGETFLRSMGVFLFSPWPLSGIVIVIALAAWSPALFIAGMTGWLSGVAVSALLAAAGAQIFWAAASYNFFLSGAALGAVFFVADVRGLFHAVTGGALAALIAAVMQVVFQYSAVSFLPIPFAVTLYLGLVVLAAPPFGAPEDRLADWAARPEENRSTRDWLRARWGPRGTPVLGIPLQGAVEVTQGFDGALSHRGAWRHALDLQRPVPPGAREDMRPSVWGEAVFSPVAGKVVSVSESVPDNPLGQANFADNWGNHVILLSGTGCYVLVGHLMQGSVAVAPGQTVDYATQLGLVGNSGRSAVPHLHLHAQNGEAAGAPTRDFRLANYFVCAPDTHLADRWHASGRAEQGEMVMAAAPNPEVRTLLAGMLPGRGIWTVAPQDGAAAPAGSGGPVVLETALQENGTYGIGQDESRMALALDVDGLRLNALQARSDSLVALLAACLATVPFAAFAGLKWTGWVPRTCRTPVARYRSALDPRRNAQLDQVALTCDAVPGLAEPGMVITARPQSRSSGLPDHCKLTIAPQRGPVQLVVRNGAVSRIYSQISFEPHER